MISYEFIDYRTKLQFFINFDKEDHLLSLSVEPQIRESLIFTSLEAEHCPAEPYHASRRLARILTATGMPA